MMCHYILLFQSSPHIVELPEGQEEYPNERLVVARLARDGNLPCLHSTPQREHLTAQNPIEIEPSPVQC